MNEIYYYKGRPYTLFSKSKIKFGGIWFPVIIYRTEYENPDGEYWVRFEQEFTELFQTAEDIARGGIRL